MGVPHGHDEELTRAQATLRDRWEEHVRCELAARDTEGTLATMVEDALP